MIALLITNTALFVSGFVLIVFRSQLGLSDELAGSLSGALLGAATVLTGVLIERVLARQAEDADRRDTAGKVSNLITPELVNVAHDLLELNEYLAFYRSSLGVPGLDKPAKPIISGMPLTDDLGDKVLVLDARQVSSLARLRTIVSKLADELSRWKDSYVIELCDRTLTLQGDLNEAMLVLADAFDRFAPGEEIALAGRKPTQAAELLRRLAQGSR